MELEVLLQRLTEAIEALAHRAPPAEARRQWYPANPENVKLLGYDTYDQFWRAIDSGLLRVGKGKEIADRRKPGSTRADYYFHLDRCLDRLETPPEKRAG